MESAVRLLEHERRQQSGESDRVGKEEVAQAEKEEVSAMAIGYPPQETAR
jgi:hypothetical protein